MIGQKFGMLTVIESTSLNANDGGSIWVCRCDCGKIINSTNKALKRKSRPRSCGCSKQIYSRKIFESNFEMTKGCWEWKGSINHGGYGKIGAIDLAHRRSYKYFIGEIPKGKQVCHACDNRICVNPNHLFLGTIGDNLRDMTNKGRRSRGSKVGTSKLNEEKVLEIRRLRIDGKEYQELADLFGVSWATIAFVCKNRYWKHVPLGEECSKVKRRYEKMCERSCI